MKLTDAQWDMIQPMLPSLPKGPRGQGRPLAHPLREILDGILWKLKSGAPWKMLPKNYPPYQTCHRWFQKLRKAGVFEKILKVLVNEAVTLGKLEMDEAYIDATFAPAKKGGHV